MHDLSIEDFRWGLEHEFPLIKEGRVFSDFSNTTFADLDSIIQHLPSYPADYASLRIGDQGIKVKRWYMEGFERFDETGRFLYTVPKGMEIRTPISTSLPEALSTLRSDIATWTATAAPFGYTAANVSFNPIQAEEFIPNPPENEWEKRERAGTAEYLHMLTYGPDINFSHPNLTTEQLIAIGKKLTFYSPYLVPFTFSSPFYKGELWGGLSRRTFYRTGRRPAVAVFLPEGTPITTSTPALTRIARIPSEIGRIEFKAFDMVADISLYEPLGNLLLGILLDTSLLGTLIVPNQAEHQKSARYGFADGGIYEQSKKVLAAAKSALPSELQSTLYPLEEMLESGQTPAHQMIKVYNKNKSILAAISN